MSANGFLYEGRDVTAYQLQKEFVWSTARIQSALESGVQTREAMVDYQARRDMQARANVVAGGRKGAQSTDRLIRKFGGAR